MKNTTAYANIAAGLVMQLERLTFPSFGEAKNIARLQSDYKAFMASDIPDAMRQYFAPWKNKLAELSRENLASYRKDLREMAEHLPIL